MWFTWSKYRPAINLKTYCHSKTCTSTFESINVPEDTHNNIIIIIRTHWPFPLQSTPTQSSMLVWQSIPVKPGPHIHRKLLIIFLHTPLSLQLTPEQWSVSLQSGPVSPGTHCVQSDPPKFSAQNTVIVRSIVTVLFNDIPPWFCCRDSATGRLWFIVK